MLQAFNDGLVTTLRTGRNGISKLAGYYAYCFQVGDTLIDTSTLYVKNELLAYLSSHPIKQIINTHHHEDHTGNNYYIQKVYGVTAYAPVTALPMMQAPPPRRQRLYLKLFWNYPRPSTPLPLGTAIKTSELELTIINTPGHCDDHVCFYNAEHQLIFTGDVYCGERVKYLRADEDFSQQLQTIRHLTRLDIETIYCAVAGKVTGGKQVFTNKLNFMEELQDKTWRLHAQGLTPIEIRDNLLGKEGLMCWFSNGHFSKQNMIKSILSAR